MEIDDSGFLASFRLGDEPPMELNIVVSHNMHLLERQTLVLGTPHAVLIGLRIVESTRGMIGNVDQGVLHHVEAEKEGEEEAQDAEQGYENSFR